LKAKYAANPINVLILEDRVSDAELMIAHLTEAGFAVISQRVDNEAGYIGCLHPGLDLILADYQLPQFDAMRALQLLHDRHLDVPFIIISGTLDDEFVVEAMKQGASDLLLKDRMARLATAVEQAMERRRTRASSEEMLRQLRQSMAESERDRSQLEAVFEAVADGIVVCDMAGDLVLVNESQARINAFASVNAMKREHSFYEKYYELAHPDGTLVPVEQWPLSRVQRGESVVNWELQVRRKDIERKWFFSFNGEPVRDKQGEQVLSVIITRDITERKRVENVLEAQRIAADAASHALAGKNQELSELYQTAQRFVDDVSHEFRTPLSVIKGYSEMMREGIAGPQSPDQMRFNQIIIDRTRDLAQMVDDLLDSSKLRAGSLRVDRRPCAVASILAAVHPFVDGRAATNKMTWVEDVDPGLPQVFADAEKATRVLVNLVVNAIKFSAEGSRIVLSAKDAGSGDVRISVRDEGPGISPENLAIIFERFRQVGTASGSSKGFGLGLNIAKELVSLNLGEMDVVSELQKGSTFSFTLPINDPTVILARLMTHLERLHTPIGAFALLRVTPERGGLTPDELRGFLASSAHPGDVIMSTLDGTALLLFGYSAKPLEWHRRLARAGRDIVQFSPTQKLGAFEVEVIDTLAYPTVLSEAASIVMQQVEAQHVTT
jgi:PAS domain S-box-containing protein